MRIGVIILGFLALFLLACLMHELTINIAKPLFKTPDFLVAKILTIFCVWMILAVFYYFPVAWYMEEVCK